MKKTGNKFPLDTNIITALLKGEIAIANNIDSADEIYIPIIVIGELYYGATFSTQVEKNTNNIRLISERYNALLIDEAVAICYGTIKAALRKKGKPIPENDIWIAAIGLRYNITIVTRDKHFKEIDGIKLTKW